ncbi:MAG: hypothetical protein KDK11_11625 [Maritimibacter sp.]|nr:hypothetical protein [Maritimibacter sp.]
MYLRKVTYRLAPAHDTPAGQAAFEHDLEARIQPLEGLVSAAHIPNDDGSWMIVAVWHDEDAATLAANVGRIAAAWDALADRLAEPRIIEAGGVDVWETG